MLACRTAPAVATLRVPARRHPGRTRVKFFHKKYVFVCAFSAGFRRKWQRHRPQEEVGPICRPMSGLAVGGRVAAEFTEKSCALLRLFRIRQATVTSTQRRRGRRAHWDRHRRRTGVNQLYIGLFVIACVIVCRIAPATATSRRRRRGRRAHRIRHRRTCVNQLYIGLFVVIA